eukprot:CAMPEP_0182848462 /NCGR_PEP_ID=MMETSP0006_2-20121128/29012_1 /TAXON_ID=97485 /ORGANISM="Prymnesium parvum, Strain Texoma1" /LENGTH=103 /DNA_ID=CAMNT_0024978879 /DNA_START=339 /DNA_END=651 /DNA_ORIENTATION=+
MTVVDLSVVVAEGTQDDLPLVTRAQGPQTSDETKGQLRVRHLEKRFRCVCASEEKQRRGHAWVAAYKRGDVVHNVLNNKPTRVLGRVCRHRKPLPATLARGTE